MRQAADALAAQDDLIARLNGELDQLTQQRDDIKAEMDALSGRSGDDDSRGEDRQAEIDRLRDELTALRAELERRRREAADERVAQAARERGLTALGADLKRARAEGNELNAQIEQARRDLAACLRQLDDDAAKLEGDSAELTNLKAELDRRRGEFNAIEKARLAAQSLLRELGERLDSIRADLDSFSDKQHRTEMQLGRMEAEFTAMTERIWEDYELTYAGAEAFRTSDFKLTEVEKRISAIRQTIRAMGAVNVGAVDEYRQTMARYDELTAQRDDLNKAQIDLSGVISDLTKKMERQFREQFALLNQNFKETFANLFGSGRAELQLGDENDVLNCDISVIAQPPGKRLQMLSLLSGGERALTAIAILFAMLKLKPTPFCFLDEIEAALDDANIDNFAEYLRDFSRDTQFVVITHRKGTMERCDALYGIAMEEKGVSRMVSVRMAETLISDAG